MPSVTRKRNNIQDVPSSSQPTAHNYDRSGCTVYKRALSLSPTNDSELLGTRHIKNLKIDKFKNF